MKIFISHSSKDKPFVRKLKTDLELNYVETWLDEDELLPGDSLLDKLNSALRFSSHFIIVLSPNSVKSDWVKYELDNALKSIESETIHKIIPIVYRKCDIPESIKKYININLSEETVYLRHNKLEFLEENYYKYLKTIIKSVNDDEKKLNPADKNEILGKNTISYQKDENLVTLNYRIVGFKSVSNFLANQIPSKEIKEYGIEKMDEFIPTVLPKQMNSHLGKLKFGDQLTFINKNGKKINAHFARYSSLNNRISIPKGIRDFLGITEKQSYKVIINGKNKSLKIEEID